MHRQYRLSVLQWNPGPARRNDTQIILAACGRFHAVILQEVGDHVSHITENFNTYTDGNDLAILLNEDTFVSVSAVFPHLKSLHQQRHMGTCSSCRTWPPASPFCCRLPHGHVLLCPLHNKVAKKRDASTSLVLRLLEHIINHSVDFIGGGFNMSAFSTVGDVFSDPEFAAPGNSLLWGLGGLDETCRECTGFIIMPRHPHTWRVQSHVCCKFDNADMGFGPRDLFPAFLHLRVTNLPGPDSITGSDEARLRRRDKAAGKQERKRLRQRLGQHASSSTATSSNVPATVQSDTTQHFASAVHTGKHHALTSPRPSVFRRNGKAQ